MKNRRLPITLNGLEQEILAEALKDAHAALQAPKNESLRKQAASNVDIAMNMMAMNEMVANQSKKDAR